MKWIQLLLALSLLMFVSCGAPGPLVTFNKQTTVMRTDTTIVTQKEMDYFCFDYDKNFNCQKGKIVTIDSATKNIIAIEVYKGTELSMRDGRQKRKWRIYEFNADGNLKRKEKTHHQTYGIGGVYKRKRKVEYLENGTKKITLKKGSKKNHNKVNRIKFRPSPPRLGYKK